MNAWLIIVRQFVLFVGVLCVSGVARGHAMDPGLLRLREMRPGVFGVLWKPPPSASPDQKLKPVLPEECSKIRGHEASDIHFEVVDCGKEGLSRRTLAVGGRFRADDEVLVEVIPLEGESVLGVLRANARQFVVPESESSRLATTSFVWLGIQHILTGWDHLLFVLGLVLLTGFRRRLIATVTAFTVAHSVTLALAVLDIVRLPVAVIEALIALSVVLLAADLSRSDRETLPFGRRYPWALAFAFGLLHGLGFAEALRKMSIPGSDLPRALLSFNVGVEIGQLCVVAALAAVNWGLTRVPLRRAAIGRKVVIEAMGIVAAFWFVQRVAAVWG